MCCLHNNFILFGHIWQSILIELANKTLYFTIVDITTMCTRHVNWNQFKCELINNSHSPRITWHFYPTTCSCICSTKRIDTPKYDPIHELEPFETQLQEGTKFNMSGYGLAVFTFRDKYDEWLLLRLLCESDSDKWAILFNRSDDYAALRMLYDFDATLLAASYGYTEYSMTEGAPETRSIASFNEKKEFLGGILANNVRTVMRKFLSFKVDTSEDARISMQVWVTLHFEGNEQVEKKWRFTDVRGFRYDLPDSLQNYREYAVLRAGRTAEKCSAKTAAIHHDFDFVMMTRLL